MQPKQLRLLPGGDGSPGAGHGKVGRGQEQGQEGPNRPQTPGSGGAAPGTAHAVSGHGEHQHGSGWRQELVVIPG